MLSEEILRRINEALEQYTYRLKESTPFVQLGNTGIYVGETEDSEMVVYKDRERTVHVMCESFMSVI